MTPSTTTLLRVLAHVARGLSLVLLPALATEAQALTLPQRKIPLQSAAASGEASPETPPAPAKPVAATPAPKPAPAVPAPVQRPSVEPSISAPAKPSAAKPQAATKSDPSKDTPTTKKRSAASTGQHSAPYLVALGTLPVRFAPASRVHTSEPPEPPAPKPKPAAASTTAPVAAAPEKPSPAKPGTPPTSTAPAVPEVTAETAPVTEPESTGKLIHILPDDTRRELRPEDILPYFRQPGSTDRDNDPTIHVVVPLPGASAAPAQPPSSANFEQK